MCIVREMTNAHVELSTLGMTNPTGPIPLEQSQGLPVHQEELGIRKINVSGNGVKGLPTLGIRTSKVTLRYSGSKQVHNGMFCFFPYSPAGGSKWSAF